MHSGKWIRLLEICRWRRELDPLRRHSYESPGLQCAGHRSLRRNHLLMSAHEFDSLVESLDGGQTWTSVPLASGMLQNVTPQFKTAFVFFIDTRRSSTTRGLGCGWLRIAAAPLVPGAHPTAVRHGCKWTRTSNRRCLADLSGWHYRCRLYGRSVLGSWLGRFEESRLRTNMDSRRNDQQ